MKASWSSGDAEARCEVRVATKRTARSTLTLLCAQNFLVSAKTPQLRSMMQGKAAPGKSFSLTGDTTKG